MIDPRSAGPNTPSAAYAAMSKTWQKIADIREGADAVRARREAYLPKYEEEDLKDYNRRLAAAPWRPEFNDALASLVAKPFSRDIGVKGADDDAMKAIVEDVDTRGNNLTLFARDVAADAFAAGLHAIFVEHTPNLGARTVAEERAAGLRPYFVHVKALDLIALYCATVGGKLLPVHARIRETVTTREGFAEKVVTQVRVLEPGRWEIWRESALKEWTKAEEGKTNLTYVPLVLYFTGERFGDHRVRPPLKDLADLQIELYQALSRQDEVLNFAGFPMLSGNGFAKPNEKIVVGPRSILYAPGGDGIQTSWSFIQPNAANIKEVRDHVGSVTADMRRLGMQPMVQRAGGVTATATSVETAKAHSVLQAWVIGLKDALEQAFVITGDYMSQKSQVELDISTDFSVEPFAQAPLTALDKARERKDISQRTYWDGLRRFDALPADFNADDEEEALAEELAGLEPEEPIDPRTGLPIPPAPEPRADDLPA